MATYPLATQETARITRVLGACFARFAPRAYRHLRARSESHDGLLSGGFGLVVTDAELDADGARRAVFLSRSPNEHHPLVLVSRPAVISGQQMAQQISFRTDSLADVRRTYVALRKNRSHISILSPTERRGPSTFSTRKRIASRFLQRSEARIHNLR